MKIGASMLATENMAMKEALDYFESNKYIEYVEILHDYPYREINDNNELIDLINSYSLKYTIHSPFIDLNIASLNSALARLSVEEIKRSIDLANMIDSNIVVVHPGTVSFSGRGKEDIIYAIGKESLKDIGDYGKDNETEYDDYVDKVGPQHYSDSKDGWYYYLPIYTSASILFALFTRLINSKLCVKLSYKKRIYFLCFWMIAGYFLMFLVLLLHDTGLKNNNSFCFVLSFIPCFFLGSSYAFGESAILAYLRLYPKILIAGWSSGTGVSGIVGGLLNFLSQLNDNFSLKYLSHISIMSGPLTHFSPYRLLHSTRTVEFRLIFSKSLINRTHNG